MAATICGVAMLVVWVGILVGLHASRGGPYTTIGMHEAVARAYERREQTWNATAPSAPRYHNPVHYSPEMPAPLPPPPRARIEPTRDIAPVWTTSLSSNQTEHELLSTLRVRPQDAASRMVYSDWLEQRGELTQAAYVRGEKLTLPALAELVSATNVAWRSITSREPVACVYLKCPKRWDQLETFGDDERTRQCPACGRMVRYCKSHDDARQVRVIGETPVIDLAAQLPPPAPVDKRVPPKPVPVDDRFDASAA